MDERNLVIADSGYIHLLYAELQSIPLIHLISGVDEDAPLLIPDGASTTAITGYTEWVSQGHLISIGWDWQMQADNASVQLTRVGGASSNVMLQTPSRVDIGPAKTAVLLEAFIDGFDWQPAALKFVNIRYSN